ncbi:MAG: hypothetical protein WAK96_12910 [Desulfobaccales bacterium]
MRGIRDIPNTGIILSVSILNGAITRLAGTMTRIFTTGTIVARVEVGKKDPRAFIPKEPPVLAIILKEPPVLDLVLKGPPVVDLLPKEPPVLAFMALEPPVLELALW